MAVKRIRLLIWAVLLLYTSSLCLPPATAQEPDGWVEMFDDPNAPEWELWEGAEISEGVLRLGEGARAWHPGEWSAHTVIMRVRRSGMFGMEYASSEEANYNLTVGDDFVEINRQHGSEVVELEMFRPILEPIEVPWDEWFELHLTRLGPVNIVGINGVRVMEAFDTDPESVPPGGILFGGMGGLVEIDEVVVIPWLAEGFSGMPEGWHISEDVLFEEDILHMPGHGFMGGGGERDDMTFSARIRREGEGPAFMMYPGHVVVFEQDQILLQRVEGDEGSEQITDLAGAELDPMLFVNEEPGAEVWMDVDIVVRDGIHTILINRERILQTESEVMIGGIALESAGAQFWIDWVNFGPPVPLWPEFGEPYEMAEGEPQGEGPSPCRITVSDMVNVREGPSTEHPVIDALAPGDEIWAFERTVNNWYLLDLGDRVGWVFGEVVQLHGACDTLALVESPDGGASPGGGEPLTNGGQEADLALTDLFTDAAPTGYLNFRVTNNGPATLSGAPITLTCSGTRTAVSGGGKSQMPQFGDIFNVSVSPGQTQTIATPWELDQGQFTYDVTCTLKLEANAYTDPHPSNDTYSEHIEGQQAGHPGGQPGGGQPPSGSAPPNADLAVTDLFPHHQPKGKLHLRITNNGPDTLQGVTISTYCGGIATDIASGAQTSIPATVQNTFDITIAPGQTHEFPTNIDLDMDKFNYTLTCEVNNPPTGPVRYNDPDISNNAYQESFQSVQQGQLIQTDLAVTDIFPQSLPQGDVYVRITKNGPDALTNATVGLNCTAVIHTYKAGDPTTTAGSSSAISVTLNAGETKEFHSGIGITDSTSYWYDFTCEVTLQLLDPDTNNNSYTETIPPPP